MNNTEKAHAYTMALTMQALGHTETPAPESFECAGGCERRVWEWHAYFTYDDDKGAYVAFCPEC
jgi:hypothetical protein